MFDELSLEAPDGSGRYRLTLSRSVPTWPPDATFRRLESERMQWILRHVREGEPYVLGQLLRFLEIHEHPSNVGTAALARMVEQRLARYPRPVMFERMPEAELRRTPQPRELPPASEPASGTSEERAYLHVETVSENENPVPGVRFEVELPDGSKRLARSDGDGSLLIENIRPGTCRIVLTELSIDDWEPDGGGSKSAGRRRPDEKHVVKQGECLSKIARSYGVDDWKLVWEHGSNAGLREKRASPHVLHAGDVVVVPGAALGELACPTDTTQRLIIKKLLAPVAILNAHLLDDVTSLTTDWASSQGTLANARELHKDDNSHALRTRDVPHGADLVVMVTA